jgi:tetratricopeptide (TPR) repeat protein
MIIEKLASDSKYCGCWGFCSVKKLGWGDLRVVKSIRALVVAAAVSQLSATLLASMILFCSLATRLVLMILVLSSQSLPAYSQSSHTARASARTHRPQDIDRANVLFKEERFSEALKAYNQALLKYPAQNDDFYQNRAQCYLEAKDFPSAVADLKKAIALLPSATKYKLLGETFYQQNAIESALQSFSKAIALDPKDYWSYKARGDIYSSLKNYPKAIGDYTRMIQIHPGEPVGYNSRAKAYQQIGKKDLAKKDFEKARKGSDFMNF